MIYTGNFKNINMITWVINEICNFNCSFCNQAHYKKLEPIDIGRLSQGLDSLENSWLFHITGGEPFLEKNIIDICKEISKKNYISFNTNLSTKNHFDFADIINPDRCLFINAAVHIEEREKRDRDLKEYIKKINYLQDRGFNVIAYYVAHPSLFDRLESDISFLKSNGVKKVRTKTFRGVYNGKYFPYAFDPNEKKFLESLEADYPEFEILNNSHKFFNKICLAGNRFFVMDRSGNLRRCSSVLKDYGNLFKKTIKYDTAPKPCPINKCACPYEGIRNVISHEGNYIVSIKDNISEKYLKFNSLVSKPQKIKKIKEKVKEYIAQQQV
jgi:MoaA/NifB/PqqE/SkfB family radical SAM enzyme